MKRIFLILVISIFAYVNEGYALTICAKNNTYIGILQIKPGGTIEDVDADNKTWKLTFDYDGTTKTVTGVAACNEISGTKSKPTTNLYTSSVDEGNYCWCKMEPVRDYGSEVGLTSYWVFYSDMSNADTCASGCTNACAKAIATDQDFRSAIYESIW